MTGQNFNKYFFHPKRNSNILAVNTKAEQCFGKVTTTRIGLNELISKDIKDRPSCYIFARTESQNQRVEDKSYQKKYKTKTSTKL